MFIDSMDVNDPMSSRSARSFNYEAIEEVNIKTAGVVRGSAGRFHERIGTGDYNNYPEGLGFNTWRIPTTSFGSGPA